MATFSSSHLSSDTLLYSVLGRGNFYWQDLLLFALAGFSRRKKRINSKQAYSRFKCSHTFVKRSGRAFYSSPDFPLSSVELIVLFFWPSTSSRNSLIPFGSGWVIKTNHETQTEKNKSWCGKAQRMQPAPSDVFLQGSWPDERLLRLRLWHRSLSGRRQTSWKCREVDSGWARPAGSHERRLTSANDLISP